MLTGRSSIFIEVPINITQVTTRYGYESRNKKI